MDALDHDRTRPNCGACTYHSMSYRDEPILIDFSNRFLNRDRTGAWSAPARDCRAQASIGPSWSEQVYLLVRRYWSDCGSRRAAAGAGLSRPIGGLSNPREELRDWIKGPDRHCTGVIEGGSSS